jgi:hypothetical protein
MRQVGTRGAAVDRLVSYLLDGPPPGPSDGVAADLAAWLSESPRFLSFVDAHRDKVRKKLRGATESQARGDVRAELETAFRLLADRRVDLAFEAYGVGKRGPDFTVTFRAVHRFNLEVTRPRLDGGPIGPDGLANAVLGKLRQLPPDAPNVLLVAVDGAAPPADEVAAAMRALKRRADGRDDPFFAGRGFAAAREFVLYYLRLSAVLVASRGGAGAQVWSNPEARRPLPAGAAPACLACLGQRGR